MLWLILAAAVSVSGPVEKPADALPAPTPTPFCLNCDRYDTPPQVLSQTRPVPPREAMIAGVEGEVSLEFTVTETGEPADVRVLRSIPMLDETAMQCVREWRFRPAQKAGKPVASTVQAMVAFRIDPDAPPTLARAFLVVPKRPKDKPGDLVRRLSHRNPAKRAEAAGKLSAIPEAGPEAVAALTALLDDTSADVRDRAAVALFAMNDPGGTLAALPARPLVSQRRPRYTRELREQKTEGTVELQLLVGAGGRVLQARFVRKATPEIDGIALAAASHWKYEPKLVEPRPFLVSTTMAFRDGHVAIDTDAVP